MYSSLKAVKENPKNLEKSGNPGKSKKNTIKSPIFGNANYSFVVRKSEIPLKKEKNDNLLVLTFKKIIQSTQLKNLGGPLSITDRRTRDRQTDILVSCIG